MDGPRICADLIAHHPPPHHFEQTPPSLPVQAAPNKPQVASGTPLFHRGRWGEESVGERRSGAVSTGSLLVRAFQYISIYTYVGLYRSEKVLRQSQCELNRPWCFLLGLALRHGVLKALDVSHTTHSQLTKTRWLEQCDETKRIDRKSTRLNSSHWE